RRGRLHRAEGEDLEEVALDDVADHAGGVVELAPAFDGDVLGHGDLDVVDVLPVPHGLEDGVAEPEDQDVLDGLLAEVVVAAEDLLLVEELRDGAVELARGGEVAAEGLLDDDARPGLRGGGLQESGTLQVAEDDGEDAGRDGEVVEPVAGKPVALL